MPKTDAPWLGQVVQLNSIAGPRLRSRPVAPGGLPCHPFSSVAYPYMWITAPSQHVFLALLAQCPRQGGEHRATYDMPPRIAHYSHRHADHGEQRNGYCAHKPKIHLHIVSPFRRLPGCCFVIVLQPQHCRLFASQSISALQTHGRICSLERTSPYGYAGLCKSLSLKTSSPYPPVRRTLRHSIVAWATITFAFMPFVIFIYYY